MRNIKNTLIALSFLLLYSCSNQPECNSDEAKELVLDILSDNSEIETIGSNSYGHDLNTIRYMQTASTLLSNLGLKELGPLIGKKERINANKFLFFKGGAGTIETVRTLNKNEDLKTCECEGEIMFSEEEMKKTQKAFLEIDSEIHINSENISSTISYNLQITDEGLLYVEVDVTDEQIFIFMTYSVFQEIINAKKNSFPNKIDFSKKYYFDAGTEDCSYEIVFNIDEDKQVNGSRTQKCYFDDNEKRENFKGQLKDKTIYAKQTNGNIIELDLTKNGLDYYMIKQVLDDGTEIDFERETPFIYTKTK